MLLEMDMPSPSANILFVLLSLLSSPKKSVLTTSFSLHRDGNLFGVREYAIMASSLTGIHLSVT